MGRKRTFPALILDAATFAPECRRPLDQWQSGKGRRWRLPSRL